MSKSDQTYEKKVRKIETDLRDYEKIEEPTFKEALVSLGTSILKEEMKKRSERIGKK